MNETEIIQGARELLSDPKRWTKQAWKNGERTCLEGALGLVACKNAHALLHDDPPAELCQAAELVLKQAQPFYPSADLAIFNDDPQTTHQDILNVLDKTLADLGALA